MSERDEDRYIKVRALVVHDGEDRIKELEANLKLEETQADAYEEVLEAKIASLEAKLADRYRRHAADVEERDRKIAELREDIRKLEGK
jgi:hypothetical protein